MEIIRAAKPDNEHAYEHVDSYARSALWQIASYSLTIDIYLTVRDWKQITCARSLCTLSSDTLPVVPGSEMFQASGRKEEENWRFRLVYCFQLRDKAIVILQQVRERT